MKTISELRDQLANYSPEFHYEHQDLLKLADIVAEMLEMIAKDQAETKRAATVADCIVNGIQPD